MTSQTDNPQGDVDPGTLRAKINSGRGKRGLARTTDEEVDIAELVAILWRRRWLIISVTGAASAIAVIVALLLPNIYRAEALLAPSQTQGASALGGLATQYGGLASLAGINLPTSDADKTAIGLQVLQSRRFISEFIKRHEILVPLMAAKGWNRESGNLQIDEDKYDVTSGKWVRNVRPPKGLQPSLQEAYEEFRDILYVSQDKTTGFVTIAIEFYSPTVARDWVAWLIEGINDSIMRRDVEEAEQAIAYLNEQVKATSLAELQSVFFRLIEEKTKTVMLAKVSGEYLLRTLDPPIAPEEKYGPARALIVLLTAALAIFLTIMFVFVTSFERDKG